ncbi:UNVERIFIED_CONTAM: hypothetical protein FKN15_004900 [Acipenser sinensis]
MVESTGGSCASPIASAHSMEASAAAYLEALGAQAGCCQEALTSSRKSGNTRNGKGIEVCAGLKTDLRFSETTFQGTWRKFVARSISVRTEFKGAGTSGSKASSELGPVTWVRWASVILRWPLGYTGSSDKPPTGGARTRAAMVESTGGSCASPIASAHSMEASAAAYLEALGAQAGCCQRP